MHPFAFVYDPASCNFIKTYTYLINGVFYTDLPPWATLDTSGVNPALRVYTTDVGYAGFYNIKIYCSVNTVPQQNSDTEFDTLLTIHAEFCSTIRFDSVTIPPIYFTIKDGQAPTTHTFAEFTDSGG